MLRAYSAPLRTRQAGGISSGTSHLLPQRWQISVSGRLGLPQLAQVTRVIFGRASLYVIYPVRPKARVPSVQNLLVFCGRPTTAVFLPTRMASNIANTIDGDISKRACRNLVTIFPRASLPFIAMKEFGSSSIARWPEAASMLPAVKYEARERIGG